MDVLTERGGDVVSMARATGVDVAAGDGSAEALRGAECVIDAASGPTGQRGAIGLFTAAAKNLHAVGQPAGVRRIVVVSTIGCDRFTAGCMAAEHAHEQAMLAGADPFSGPSVASGPPRDEPVRCSPDRRSFRRVRR